MRLTAVVPLLAVLAPVHGLDSLRLAIDRLPADSLVRPLGRLEAGPRGPAAEAAMLLGKLHYARGEYRAAAEAFARGAARLDPARKPEARYWVGLSWLGLGDASQARSALEEVAASASPRRSLATLALAQAWDLAGKPNLAFDLLGRLLDGDPGEAGPAALARYAALAEGFDRTEAARRARTRLLRDYPTSIEAAGARLARPSVTER